MSRKTSRRKIVTDSNGERDLADSRESSDREKDLRKELLGK